MNTLLNNQETKGGRVLLRGPCIFYLVEGRHLGAVSPFFLLAKVTPKLILKNYVHQVRQDDDSGAHHYKTPALKSQDRLKAW